MGSYLCCEWDRSEPARGSVEVMTSYIPRTVDGELNDLLEGLPAISIEGPKGVGKTVTAQRRADGIAVIPAALLAP